MRALLTVVLVAASTTVADDGAAVVKPTFEAGPKRGELIFMTYCHHCHGPRADGTGHIGRGLMVKPVDLTAPELAPRMTAEAIARIVREGSSRASTAMIPWKLVLPDDAIRDVATYTAKLAAEGRARREKGAPAK
jgi:mono/diheme cytochrome c family protein